MLYVLDTNIFNRLLDGKLQLGDLPNDGSFAASSVQVQELRKTPDTARRDKLLKKFREVDPEILATETFVADVSWVDKDKVGDGRLFEDLRAALDALNKSKANNVQDALIGELAIANGFTLITADKQLANVVQGYGGTVLFLQ